MRYTGWQRKGWWFPITQKNSAIKIILLFVGALTSLIISAGSFAAAEPQGVDAILTAAESVFQCMNKGDYVLLWSGLTAKSRHNIIRNVQKAISKEGSEEPETLISADFEKGGKLAHQYWDAYLNQFDPKMVLDDSVWKMGEVKKDQAEIILRYKKSFNDAVLKMYREGGTWKVGLDESFSTRQP